MTQARAAIYFRVSTEEQATEGQSIPAQRRALVEYAAHNGYEVVAEFADEGASARTAQRTEFQRMITEAKRKPRPFDAILVHKWDRFARNREDSIVYKKLLRRECGVEVMSITEPLEDGPVGVLLEGILELLAEFYSLNLAQEVRKGMKQGASSGKAMGLAPLGYRIGEEGRLIVVPEEAAVVRWIYEQYVARAAGLRGLALDLRQTGSAVFGEVAAAHSWSATGLRQIISNPAYKGTLTWNRRDSSNKGRFRPQAEWITVDEAHEPVVSAEQWEAANEILAGRGRPRSPKTEYLLYGLVRCLDCGGGMSKQTMKWTRSGQSAQQDVLRCTRNAHSGECYYNYIGMEEIETALVAHFEKFGSGAIDLQDVAFEAPAASNRPHLQESKALHRALSAIGDRYDRQVQAYESGLLSLDQLRRAKERLDGERTALERRALELEEAEDQPRRPASSTQIQETIAKHLGIIRDPNVPLKRRRESIAAILHSLAYSREHDTLRVILRERPLE